MANTRFNYDDCRTAKRLQQSTDPCRWILNVPGNGDNPSYIEDPHIRIQKWGGNIRTNMVGIEDELRGRGGRILDRDCTSYKEFIAPSENISFPSNNTLFTDQSRATNPAWIYREIEQANWQFPQLNPQENVCLPFLNNLNTRIIVKDNFVPTVTCNNNTNFSYGLPIDLRVDTQY